MLPLVCQLLSREVLVLTLQLQQDCVSSLDTHITAVAEVKSISERMLQTQLIPGACQAGFAAAFASLCQHLAEA